jgi:hypothetical protein
MPRAEWRSPATYEDLRSLDAPGFAWEFLSRNPAFERDCKRLELADDQDPLSAGELDDFARRWGVRFRKARASRPPSSLDAGEPTECDPDNPTPTRSRQPEPQT